MAFLTTEDIKVCFSLICCVCGIGTLQLPGNYARAGYFWATLALAVMAVINTYATWCMSQVMLVAPKSVLTFGDLGEWSMGKFGRGISVLSQISVCVMCPIVFLVLGGQLLTTLFPGSFEDTTWIISMGIMLVPLCLVPTMQEGAGAAAAGCLGTLVADVVAIFLLISNMSEQNTKDWAPPPSSLSLTNIVGVFGNLSLAYGAGIIIPSLQREHSQPERMPRAILVSMAIISTLFLAVSIAGVFPLGCQVPGNLLFTISGSQLGFEAHRGLVVFAYLFMQLHITIAFAVIIFPAFFFFERMILRLHTRSSREGASGGAGESIETPSFMEDGGISTLSIRKSIQNEFALHDEFYHSSSSSSPYTTPGSYLKAVVLRMCIIVFCIVVAVVFKDNFGELMEFVGASATALCCMILPIAFYLKAFRHTMSAFHKVFAFFSIVVITALAIYVTFDIGMKLVAPAVPSENVTFKYCEPQYQQYVFTNTSYYNSAPPKL